MTVVMILNAGCCQLFHWSLSWPLEYGLLHSYSPALHSPGPSSSKPKKRAATLSEESEAFQKCSADLISEIQEPEVLAWNLFSSNIISKKEVDEVSMVGLSVAHRKARLLSAVGNQIGVDPAKFKNLLLVLRKQSPLKDIVKKLEATYRSHLKVGDRGTGLKGLSQLTLSCEHLIVHTVHVA